MRYYKTSDGMLIASTDPIQGLEEITEQEYEEETYHENDTDSATEI